MKKLFIFAAFLIICWADEPKKFDEEDDFQQKLGEAEQNIKNIIREKIEELRITFDSLDPYDVETQRIQIKTPVELDLNISQSIHGLLDFEITKLDVQLLNKLIIDFTVNWPSMLSHNNYGLLVIVGEREFFGNGEINIYATNFAISGHVSSNIEFVGDGMLMQIEELTINLSLGSGNCIITGYMNDEEESKLLSESMTALVQPKLKELQRRLNEKMPEIIVLLNQLIMDETLLNMIKLNPLNILSKYNFFQT